MKNKKEADQFMRWLKKAGAHWVGKSWRKELDRCPHFESGSPDGCTSCGAEDCPHGSEAHYLFTDGCPHCGRAATEALCGFDDCRMCGSQNQRGRALRIWRTTEKISVRDAAWWCGMSATDYSNVELCKSLSTSESIYMLVDCMKAGRRERRRCLEAVAVDGQAIGQPIWNRINSAKRGFAK